MEGASPASVQQADGHTCLARAAVIVDLDPGIDVSLPLHALQVIGIHTEAWGQLNGSTTQSPCWPRVCLMGRLCRSPDH